MAYDHFDHLVQKFVQRPNVRRWLLDQHRVPPLEDCLQLEPVAIGRSYTDLPRPSDELLKRGVKPNVFSKPGECTPEESDIGDTYLFHHYQDDCALGIVLGSKKFHPVLPSFAKFGLISSPEESARFFAIDLNGEFVDYVETSFVDNATLLVHMRRTCPNPNGYCLADIADIRLYRTTPEIVDELVVSGVWSLVTHGLALRFSYEEISWRQAGCRFCTVFGRAKCECPPSMRGRDMQRGMNGEGGQVGTCVMASRDWTAWRDVMKGIKSAGYMGGKWSTIDVAGNETMFLSTKTSYSVRVGIDGAINRRIQKFYTTTGPHEAVLSVPRLVTGEDVEPVENEPLDLTTSTVPIDASNTGLSGTLQALTTALSLPMQPMNTLATDSWGGSDPLTSYPLPLQNQIDNTLPAQVSVLSHSAHTMPMYQRDEHFLDPSIERTIMKKSLTRRPRCTSIEEDGRSIQIWTCEHCGQQIRGKKGNYNRHIAVTHRNELRFKCMFEGCGQVFGYKLNAQRHFINKHLSKTYPCSRCKRTFKSESKRDLHVTSVHAAGKECFDCSSCGAAFGRKSTLNRHIKNMHA